jgi:hypothetical protein
MNYSGMRPLDMEEMNAEDVLKLAEEYKVVEMKIWRWKMVPYCMSPEQFVVFEKRRLPFHDVVELTEGKSMERGFCSVLRQHCLTLHSIQHF